MINSIQDIQNLVCDGVTDFSLYGHVRTFISDGMIGFDYTEKAEFEGNWNFFECVSRGLVIDIETGTVLARPYDKFFNLGQHGAHITSPIISVDEKDDGSLGILYQDNKGNFRANTRGSFSSDQALWATKYMADNEIIVPIKSTVLGEIVYPDNRIVVGYGGQETIIIHGIRSNETGEYWSRSKIIDFYHDEIEEGVLDIVETHPVSSIEDIVSFVNSRPGIESEGVVVTCEDGTRVKIKSDDYLRLHRLVTDVTPKRVWEIMCAGCFDEHMTAVPDEFHEEVLGYKRDIDNWVEEMETVGQLILNSAPQTTSRKEYAQWVMEQPKDFHNWLFCLIDGKVEDDYFLKRWKKMNDYKGA